MPYLDSIGQPAGYGNSPYGNLQVEDTFGDVVNPVTEGDLIPMPGMFNPATQPPPTPLNGGMGPEMLDPAQMRGEQKEVSRVEAMNRMIHSMVFANRNAQGGRGRGGM